MISTCFEAMSLFRNLPKEAATLGLLLPRQGKLWCFWHETPTYIVPMTLIQVLTPGQFFTPTNHHPAFIVSDRFLGMVGGANIADQRKSTAGINYWYSAHAIHRRNLVENSEMM